MWVEICPLITYRETTPELSSQSQNKIQPQSSSRVGASPPECSGVWGSTARPWSTDLIIISTEKHNFSQRSDNLMYIFWHVFSSKMTLKALAHYNWNYKKRRYLSYTLQLFFTTTLIFSTVLYIDNDSPNDFFRKIFVKVFVVCKGLNRPLRTVKPLITKVFLQGAH